MSGKKRTIRKSRKVSKFIRIKSKRNKKNIRRTYRKMHGGIKIKERMSNIYENLKKKLKRITGSNNRNNEDKALNQSLLSEGNEELDKSREEQNLLSQQPLDVLKLELENNAKEYLPTFINLVVFNISKIFELSGVELSEDQKKFAKRLVETINAPTFPKLNNNGIDEKIDKILEEVYKMITGKDLESEEDLEAKKKFINDFNNKFTTT